jgi:hypothetical protein
MTNWKPVSLILLSLIATAAFFQVRKLAAAGAEPGNRPRSLLLVEAEPPRLMFASGAVANDAVSASHTKNPGSSPSAGDSSDTYQRFMETQCVLIKSRMVIDPALHQPGISELAAIKSQADPITWLEQFLDATRLKDTQLLQIALGAHSGASNNGQAVIINAVVRAYMEQVVNSDTKRRADRHAKLKKVKQTYADIIRERRETQRKLALSVGNNAPLTNPEKNSMLRRQEGLLERQLKLRLDRAEAETLLERRRKLAGAQTEPVRKEIAQLEDRLAVLTAHERVLQEAIQEVASDKHRSDASALDLRELEDEISQMEGASRKIAAEVEALNIELDASPRVRIIEQAVAPK